MVRHGGTVAVPRLPAERSSFVGRRHELDQLRRALGPTRIVTLVGPGGVGKTRLALRAASQLQRRFPDGAAVVELASVREPALVASAVAAALDVRDQSGRWVPGQLAEVLRDRRLLLVLDDCEHLADPVAVLIDALLRRCPGLHVVATSRRPLDVDGEVRLRVPPLPVPEPAGAEDPMASDAVQLLVDRARATGAALDLTQEELQALAELCRRLDGIPLAIEMAAARLRTLPPAEVVARLGDRFRLLRRAGAATPERHRTLRATMQWSHDLLGDVERLLWRRASVFAAEFDVAAAEAVCADADLPAETVLDGLTGLIEASVLDVVRRGGGPRFRMLETVRSFGEHLLDDSGEGDCVRLRHAEWCAGTAAAASAHFAGPGQVDAFDLLEGVHAELGAAVEHCCHTPGLEETGLRIVSDLWLYWSARGHLTEGRQLVGMLLDRCPPEAPARPRGLACAGFLALSGSEPETATPLLESSIALAEAAGDAPTVALAVQYRGLAALFLGELEAAKALLRRAAEAHRAVDRRYSAFCMADVGIVALLQGLPDEAATAFRESLRLNEGGDPWTRSHALWGTSLVHLAHGEPQAAGRVAEEALRLMRTVDDRSGVARCVEALSWAAAAHDPDRTARLAGAADAVWRSIPAAPPAPVMGLRTRYTGPARRALGESRWSSRYREGATLDRAEAVALALGEVTPSGQASTPADPDDPLTSRQREVAVLVAEGLTDRQIAERLVISPRTAESHVEQILTRLGFRSRAEIAAWTATRRRAR